MVNSQKMGYGLNRNPLSNGRGERD